MPACIGFLSTDHQTAEQGNVQLNFDVDLRANNIYNSETKKLSFPNPSIKPLRKVWKSLLSSSEIQKIPKGWQRACEMKFWEKLRAAMITVCKPIRGENCMIIERRQGVIQGVEKLDKSWLEMQHGDI